MLAKYGGASILGVETLLDARHSQCLVAKCPGAKTLRKDYAIKLVTSNTLEAVDNRSKVENDLTQRRHVMEV